MSPIPQRNLGGDAKDISVGAMGHGLMQLTWTPSPVSDDAAFASMKAAADAGATFWNSGQFYGNPPDVMSNLRLLKRFFEKYPEYINKITLSIKGGMGPKGLHGSGPDSTIDNLRRDLKEIKEALGDAKSIDIYEPARVDPKITIEDATRNLATLQKEGLFKHIGMSEIAADAIRRAHAISPIAAVEIEVSLWLEAEALKVISTCKELDIAVIAYSPLGRGFLAGKFKSPADFEEGDFRKMLPQFSEENFPKNLKIVDQLNELASKKGCTAAQLALAWVLSLYDKIIPIPGSSSTKRVQDNIESANIQLSKEEKDQLQKLVDDNQVAGDRYPEQLKALCWGTGKV